MLFSETSYGMFPNVILKLKGLTFFQSLCWPCLWKPLMYFLKCLSNFNHPCHQYLMLTSLSAHCSGEVELRRIYRFSIQIEKKAYWTETPEIFLQWNRGDCLYNSLHSSSLFFNHLILIRHLKCSLFVQLLCEM